MLCCDFSPSAIADLGDERVFCCCYLVVSHSGSHLEDQSCLLSLCQIGNMQKIELSILTLDSQSRLLLKSFNLEQGKRVMIISDLNYLETVSIDVQGAGGVNFNSYVEKDVDIDVNVDFDIDKDVTVNVDIKGNLATAEASADAFGDNTLAETEAFAQTSYNFSEAFSSATAATY